MQEDIAWNIGAHLFNSNIFTALLESPEEPDKIVVKAVNIIKDYSERLSAEFVEEMLYLRPNGDKSSKDVMEAKRAIIKQYENRG